MKIPVVVRVDNIGAIFMSENSTTSSRTRHVDIRYHFVREFVFDGFIKIIFVRSEKNLADGFRKNINGQRDRTHNQEYLSEKSAIDC